MRPDRSAGWRNAWGDAGKRGAHGTTGLVGPVAAAPRAACAEAAGTVCQSPRGRRGPLRPPPRARERTRAAVHSTRIPKPISPFVKPDESCAPTRALPRDRMWNELGEPKENTTCPQAAPDRSDRPPCRGCNDGIPLSDRQWFQPEPHPGEQAVLPVPVRRAGHFAVNSAARPGRFPVPVNPGSDAPAGPVRRPPARRVVGRAVGGRLPVRPRSRPAAGGPRSSAGCPGAAPRRSPPGGCGRGAAGGASAAGRWPG